MVDAPLPPPEEGRAENLWFKKKKKKNLDKKRFSLPLGPKRAWRVMDGPTPDHTLLPLSPAGSSGRFESVIKGPTHAPSAKLWNQVSVALHTQTPLWSDTGRVPAFHLAAPPRVRRWSRRSRLYSVWVPGKSATQLVSLAPVDHLTRLRDSVRPAFSQVPPHSSKGLCGEITVLLARDVMEPVPPADMKTGFYSPYFIVPKKGGGWRPILDLRVLNWASFRSKDSRRSASSGASVPEIGLQRLTWRTCTSLSQSFRTTGHSCGLRLKDGHISTRSCLSSCPCHPVSSRKLWRQPLFPWENRAFAFSTTSTTGSCCLSLRTSCANTGTWCSCTSASWAFGSTGKRANSPRRRGSLFSVWNWIRSIRQHASRRNVLSRCWTAWMRSRAGPRSHWNNFRGSWGIWQLRRQWRRWGCFIWDRFNTGSMAESRGGRGNAALTGSKSHRPATKPSPRGQTFRLSGQECPWNRSLGMLWFTRMPPPPAGAPRSTGLQCRGFGRGPQLHWHISCLELLQYTWPWTVSRGAYRASTYWSVRTHCDRCIHQPTRWSTLPSYVATRPPPPPMESEASEVASCHSHSGLAQLGSRRAVTSCAPRRVETPSPAGPAYWETSHCQLFTPWPRKHSARNALALSWPRGPRKYAFPPVSILAQTLCKIREDEEQVLLVAPYWSTQTWFPELMLLVTAPPWQIPLR